MTVPDMLRLPWRWRGPTQVSDQAGNAHFELRIDELPDFFVAAPTRDQVLAECTGALAEFLQSYADYQEMPPQPANPVPTWKVPEAPVMTARLPDARRPEEPVLILA